MPLNLVVQTAFLGDLLLSIPLLKRCRQIWPDQQLGLVCRKGFGDFFLKTKLVDQVFEIKKGDASTYEAILANLKNQEVNHLISPHQSMRTVFFCRKIQAKHKISFKNFWNFLVFSERVVKPISLPDSLRQMSLLSVVDADLKAKLSEYASSEHPYTAGDHGKLSAPPRWASMSLRSNVLALKDIYQSLQDRYNFKPLDEGRGVLLFPGSVWATKRWTTEGFVGVGQDLQKKGYQVYVMGGPGEELLAEQIAAQIPGSISVAGKTAIIESAQVIARAKLVIGNDSASAHLAAMCETPLIAVFGPTVLEFGFRPWSADTYIAQKENLACRPCGKHGHKVCPIKTHVCMKNLPAEQVLQTAEAILR